jgi:UDPglucose--hexose-1-phosphate uridylyltransferase
VVPNLYPITPEHEVAVLSPAHDRSFAQLTEVQAAEALAVLRDRTRFHLERGAIYVQSLINHGRAAGASIEHPHAQIVPLDVVPPAGQHQLDRFHELGTDPIEDVAASVDDGSELAVLCGPAPVWCSAAGATPFEFRAAFRGRASRFDDASDAEITAVAVATREALGRLAAVLGDVPYNLIVHTAPRDATFHWYVEVQTRIAVVAGFELGTGIFVNVTPPELAAKQLREAGKT